MLSLSRLDSAWILNSGNKFEGKRVRRSRDVFQDGKGSGDCDDLEVE